MPVRRLCDPYRAPVDLGPWDDDELFGDADERDPNDDQDREPTPGERLLYALGQLYKLFRHGALNVRPEHFEVWDLAGILGVHNDIEFISENRWGSHWHFADEVLHVNTDAEFPWRLLTGRPLENKQPELVERFRERLAEVGIPEAQAAVLAWTNALVDRLNGRKGSDRPLGSWLLRVLGAAAVERDERTGPTGETFRRLDRAVAFVAFGSGRPANSTYEQREDTRTASAQLLEDLPKVEGELRAWNLTARDALGAAAAAVSEGSPARNVRSTMTAAAALAGVDAREALAPPPAALARTIHDAKGENLAAVLVVARDEDAVLWANSAWTEAPPDDMTEETRVAYVAFTRAERLLVLAIPSGAADSVAAKLRAVGFSDLPDVASG
jgi:hypothetical protein